MTLVDALLGGAPGDVAQDAARRAAEETRAQLIATLEATWPYLIVGLVAAAFLCGIGGSLGVRVVRGR